jgi:hypothetical protein
LLENTGNYVSIHSWDSDAPPVQDIPIATCATAHTFPDGTTIILVFNQALFLGDAHENSLICPNQLRCNGIMVDECPRHLANGSKTTHSIHVHEDEMTIPLEMDGVISYFSCHKPTKQELRTCERIEMTSPDEWDPKSLDFNRNERKLNVLGTQSRGLMAFDYEHETEKVIEKLDPVYSASHFIKAISRIYKVVSEKTRNAISADNLASIWGIGLDAAKATLNVTTQSFIRQGVKPMEQRYRTAHRQFFYDQLNDRFYADVMFSTHKSLSGNTCATVFVNGSKCSYVQPMEKKSETPEALQNFYDDIGVPNHLHTDGGGEFTGKRWKKVRITGGICKQTTTEPHSPWQNAAEMEIKELKKQVARLMKRSRCSPRLWDYAITYVSQIRSRTAFGTRKQKSRTGYEIVTGNTPDISEWAEFQWYQPVWFYDNTESWPTQQKKLARWLGVSHRVGQAMCYFILMPTGRVISRTSVHSPTPAELETQEFKNRLSEYDRNVKERIDGQGHTLTGDWQGTEKDVFFEYDDNEPEPAISDPDWTRKEADDYTEETFDNLVSAQVQLPFGGEMKRGTVANRKRDNNGNPLGMRHENPLLDSRVYEINFDDGTVGEFQANMIAENIFAKVDSDGNEHVIFDEIIDHKKDNSAVTIENMYLPSGDGSNPKLRRTTIGWKLCVQWKDGTTSWIPLKELKESNPVETAEYAVANKLDQEPAFVWWIKDVLKKRDRIIKAVKSRYLRRTHKFGIEIPKTVREALELDKTNGNDYWRKAIEKEMKNVMPAFKFTDNVDGKETIGLQKIKCHMIFDVKMDFTRKARFVAGGHMTEPPASITYSSVVARDSVRIAFMLAALHEVDVLAADIGNAYLNAPCREKVYCMCGPEFGPNEGKTALIVRALYGLKSSGAAWRAHLAQTMHDIGFKPTRADPDVWIRPAIKPDGYKYYEYVLIYVDDILCCSHKAKDIMDTLAGLYRLKEDPKTGKKYDKPTRYLGANLCEYKLDDDMNTYWSISAEEYVKEAVRNVEAELDKVGMKFNSRIQGPMATGYKPELDVTPLLDPGRANYYQNLIGILRWSVELGRIDIHYHVAVLSRYLAAPREGHLEQVFSIFAYLKRHLTYKLVMDSTPVTWDEKKFPKHNWDDFYPDAAEQLPPNMPEPRGKSVQINCFVDADHAGDVVSRRSHTGIILYVNRAPIIWYSKRQNTVETSTFGSEFIAMKIATEMIEGLRYKLRMFGVPIDGPANVFGDNQSVITNASVPESPLKKKHVAICYHRVREACASDTIRIAKEKSETNLTDILTKNVPRPQHKYLAELILRYS